MSELCSTPSTFVRRLTGSAVIESAAVAGDSDLLPRDCTVSFLK